MKMQPILLMLRVVSLIGIFYWNSSHADSWTQKASFPGIAREHPFSFSIDGKGYIGTGKTSSNELNDFWEYDPAVDVWTQKANFPGDPRLSAVGFTIGNKGYAGTGCRQTVTTTFSDFYEYDPATNVWTQKADFGGGPRAWAAGFSIAGKGYLGTGWYNVGPQSDFWEYDPTFNLWTQKASFSGVPRILAVGFAINDKGYISTGSSGSDECWEYDPVFDSWTQKANLPGPGRMDAAAFSICGKGFVGIGGESPFYKDLWEFDPVANQWTQKTDFPGQERDDAAFFSIGDKGYIGLGEYNGSIMFVDFYEYTPDSVCTSAPIINLASSDTIFCEKHCINFFDLSTNNPTSWQWFFPGSDSITSTLQNPTNICYSTYGSFDVTLIACNAAGCDTLVLPGFINEYQIPTPSITQSNDTLFSSPGVTYQWWSVDSGIITGATNSYYIPTQGGSYYVIVTDSNGCEGASNTIIITAIHSLIEWGKACVIMPNPNNGLFTITLNETLKKDFSVRIINPIGQTIFNHPVTEINISNISEGLYGIQVINDGKVYFGRFVVE